MTILFNREASIIAQHPDHKDITIQNLRIQFDIEKFWSNTLNTGTITIYNLNPENRRLLVKRKSDLEGAPFTTINLIAGYEGAAALIFRGNLYQGFSIRQGPDWITTLQCVTAFDQFVSAHHPVEDSFEEITAFDLISKLMGIFGTTRFATNVALQSAVHISDKDSEELKQFRVTGNAYSGRVIDSVTKILARLGMVISFDDFETLIAKEFQPVNPNEIKSNIPLINTVSGLLGSPQITEVGVKVNTLLNNKIRVVQLFSVESDTTKQNDIRGQETQTFTCTKLKHTGDTHSDDWQSEILGAWFPELDFTGEKNTVAGPRDIPQLKAFISAPVPPVPVPPL